MTVTYPYATTSIRRDGTCALCVLTGTHPERDEVEPMYSAFLSEALATTLCKAHAIECDLITDRLVAAKTRAEVAVIQHLRGEEHRHDVCPLPHEEEVRGCSCGMADYGAPGHDGHEEEVSHGETDPEPLHDCGLCDSPLKFNGWNDDGTATWTCTKCDWFHLSTDCCEEANRPSHRETDCNKCGVPDLSPRWGGRIG